MVCFTQISHKTETGKNRNRGFLCKTEPKPNRKWNRRTVTALLDVKWKILIRHNWLNSYLMTTFRRLSPTWTRCPTDCRTSCSRLVDCLQCNRARDPEITWSHVTIHYISRSWSRMYCPEILAMFNHLLIRVVEYPPPHRNKPVRGKMRYWWVQCDDCPHWYHTICIGIRHLWPTDPSHS